MRLCILGTRGVPAQHGGFETFAEQLALYLVKRNWNVTVYCQVEGSGKIERDSWNGIDRVMIPVQRAGALGTLHFDWRSITDILAGDQPDLVLTLGYNTASFCIRLKLNGIRNVINMDGLEWQRDKWRLHERAWLWLNERAGCWFGDHLIADHPEIARHLASRVSLTKVTTIPYGAVGVKSADASLLKRYGIEPDRYAIVIARPEPENSILEIVRAFSRRSRGMKLVMLGNYRREQNKYHAAVLSAASDEVLFPGAIYDLSIVAALRYYTRLYIHGHRVGGTNPSLVEALGAGSPVLAHDNRFNRWVAGQDAVFFDDEAACADAMSRLLDVDVDLSVMRTASLSRHAIAFTWETVLRDYEELLIAWLPQREAALAFRAQ